MIWFMVFQVVSILVELVRLGRKSDSEKDSEILLLRRQLGSSSLAAAASISPVAPRTQTARGSLNKPDKSYVS
jgi:hypothetical protein